MDSASAWRPAAANAPGLGSTTAAHPLAPPSLTPPSLTLPKGGGAIRGLGEKFAANPVTGTGSVTVPIPTSPGRAGFGPQLALSYDSARGNGPFGLGWSLSLPAITRKSEQGLPRYRDAEESDVFLLSGVEDLVPVRTGTGAPADAERTLHGVAYRVRRYRPRIEGLFARIERWTRAATGETHWRSLTTDNVTSLYGVDAGSTIRDPEQPDRVYSWLLHASYDDRGNVTHYGYRAEDARGVDLRLAHE